MNEPGWYPDPSGRFAARFWDGAAWTPRVWQDEREVVDLAANGLTLTERDRAVIIAYLHDAFERGQLDAPTLRNLVDDVRRRAQQPVAARTAPGAEPLPQPRPTPTPPPTPTSPPTIPAPPPTPVRPLAPPPPPIPVAPSAIRTWWDDVRTKISADLAVHGLAYLGVLLLFAGVFGFVAFAFGDVAESLRPVAELALPLSILGAGWFLRARGAPFVGSALELLGGALLPVLAIAAMVDGVDPDLAGGRLLAYLVVLPLVVAGIYAVITVRRPKSTLRYLVAPLVWLAVALAGLAFADEMPEGADITEPLPAQWALVCVAVAATLGLVRWRPGSAIGRATVVSAVPAGVLAFLVTLLASGREGWPVAPLVVAGAATVVSIELLSLLRADADQRLVAISQAAVVAVTTLSLRPELGDGWAAAAAALSLLALAEWQDWRRPDGLTTGIPLGAAAVAAVLVVSTAPMEGGTPWAAVTATGVGWAWAVIRHHVPLRSPVSGDALVGGIALLPIGVLVGLGVALAPRDALIALGVWVAATAVVVRLTSARDDMLWAAWIRVGAFVATAWALGGGTDDPWYSATALACAAVAFALAPRWTALSVWTGAGAAAGAFGFAAYALDLSSETVATAVAVAGLLLVLIGTTRREHLFGHIGAVGSVVTVSAAWFLVHLQADRAEPFHVLVMGSFAMGWVAVAAAQETRGSAEADLLWRATGMLADAVRPPVPSTALGPPAPASLLQRLSALLPAAFALLGLTALVAVAIDAAGWFSITSAWPAVAAGVVPLAGAALTRIVPADHRPLCRVLPDLGFALVLGLSVLTFGERGPAAAALTLVVAYPFVVVPERRRASMEWIGWLASAAVAILVADISGQPRGDLHLVLLGWGTVALVGGLGLDEVLAGPRLPGEWTRCRFLTPGVVLSPIALLAGLAPSFLDGSTAYGWWSLVVAVVVAVAAAQLRSGGWTVVSWTLASVSYAALVSWEPMDLPWTWLPWAVGLLVVAEAATRLQPPASEGPTPTWWARWDLPPFVVAHGTTVLALGASLAVGWVPATWGLAGATSIAVGARLRRAVWVVVGASLVVVAAAVLGPGWLTLALAVVSVAATGAGALTSGPARRILQTTGVASAAAAWISAIWWQQWNAEQATTITALVAGGIAVTAFAACRLAGLGRDWVLAWAGLGTAGVTASALFLLHPSVDPSPAGLAVAGGTGLLALGCGTAAEPTGQRWLREASTTLVVAALAVLAYGIEASAAAVVVASAIGAVIVAISTAAVWHTAALKAWIRPMALAATLANTAALAVGAATGRADLVAAALASIAVAALIFSTRVVGTARVGLHWLAAASTGGTWIAWLVWQEWTADDAVTASALAAGALAIALAASVRYLDVKPAPVAPWALLALATLASAAVAIPVADVDRTPAGHALALGGAAAAAAVATSARPLGRRGWRETAAVMLGGAFAAEAWAVDAGTTEWVVVASIVGVTTTVLVVAAWALERAREWRTAGLILGGLASAAALVAATTALPDRSLLVAALLVTALESAAIGLVSRRLAFLVGAPILVCAAWITFASEALAGEPQWFTVPIGVTVLIVVGLARSQFRRSRRALDDPALLALEFVGMAFVVGSAYVQTVTDGPIYGLIGIGLSVAICVWGVVTRVRRRLAFGSAATVGYVIVMIVVPLARLVPGAGGPALWLTLAAVGLAAILVAAFLERGRDATRTAVARLRELTDDWE